MFKMSIPSFSSEELWNRYQRVKPVIKYKGKYYNLKEFSKREITDICYLWDVERSLKEEIEEQTLEPLTEITCITKYGYMGIFKPSIGEILAQIDLQKFPKAQVFEIIEEPKKFADINEDEISLIAFNNGYHFSKVRLYSIAK